MTADTKSQAYREGYEHGRVGHPGEQRLPNPYVYPSYEWWDWSCGWHRGFRELCDKSAVSHAGRIQPRG